MADAATQAQVEPQKKKGFKFPTAFTVLFFVLLIVWGLTFVIKPGRTPTSRATGTTPSRSPAATSRSRSTSTFTDRLNDLWLSPVNGLYGIREVPAAVEDAPLGARPRRPPKRRAARASPAEIVTAPGNTGPYNTGAMAGAVQVFFFVLAIGAFITVTMRTGALDAGIARVTHRFRTRGLLLITILMVIFSIGGTTYGMAEETLGFYALLVPDHGRDRVRPDGRRRHHHGRRGRRHPGLHGQPVRHRRRVRLPPASRSGDGIVLRVLMYIVLTIVAILYVLRYARKVKADPAKSLSHGAAGRRPRLGAGGRRGAAGDDRPAEGRDVGLRASPSS